MTELFIHTVGLQFDPQSPSKGKCSLTIEPKHLNGNGVVHGGALFTLADTGMGYALYSSLDADEMCATIEIKINYFRAVTQGKVVCTSTVLHRGKSTANLDAVLEVDGTLVAKANGTFAIFARKNKG